MKTLHPDSSKIWTLEEFLQLEEVNHPCELINGKLFESPALPPYHQEIAGRLFVLLFDAASATDSEAYYSLSLFIDKCNVFQPDILYLSPEKRSFISERGIEGPPDLVVEVLSPVHSQNDKGIKKKTYLEFGVNEYWIVDPFQKNITVYTQSSGQNVPSHIFSGKDSVSTPYLSTLTFNLDKIFSNLCVDPVS